MNGEILKDNTETLSEQIVEPTEAEKRQLQRKMDLLKLKMSLTGFAMGFATALPRYGFGVDGISIDYLEDEEIKKDIAKRRIKFPKLIDSINRSFADFNEIVFAFRVCETDKHLKSRNKHYFLIATMDGFFFFVRKKIAFVEYGSLRAVSQDANGVVISARKVNWYSEDGKGESGGNEIVIEKNKETQKYLMVLREGLEKIIAEFGRDIEVEEEFNNTVEDIVAKYIFRIPKGRSAVPYLVKDFKWDDVKTIKKMKNALAKYALKVHEDEVIGFIDTSFFGNGGDGILFSKYGIAFDFAFEKVFAKYGEICGLEIKKGKELVLHGRFSERKDDFNDPSINDIYYNITELKECLEEIGYAI